MRCSEAESFVHAYVDGELAGVDRNAYEHHLHECEYCSRNCRLQGRFKAAVRGHLPPREVPEGLRRRIESAIATAPPPPRQFSKQLWPKLVPALFAAGAIGSMFITVRGQPPSLVLQQALRTFNAPMPMDVVSSSCSSIAEWFRGKVDFTVRPPAQALAARCEGGRLLTVRDRLAAYLTFQALGGHKLGLLVYDGDDEELEAPLRRSVNGFDIYLDTRRGASIAAFRNWDGLNYVVTGDLDTESLTNVLTTAFRQ